MVAGIRSVLRFVSANSSDTEPPEPTIVTLQRVLTELMNDEQVLACLADHGVSPETLLAELGQPSTVALYYARQPIHASVAPSDAETR